MEDAESKVRRREKERNKQRSVEEKATGKDQGSRGQSEQEGERS